jgi:hypothetical protein
MKGAPARAHAKILDMDGTEVGEVTSGRGRRIL